MTDALLAEKPDLEETWMRGAMLNRLGAVRLSPSSDPAWSPRISLADWIPSSPQPEDLIGPTVFLLSNASSWMTGSDVRVDGGHTASA